MEARQNSPKVQSKIDKILSTYIVRQAALWIIDMCSILIATLVSLQLLGQANTNISEIIMPLITYMALHTVAFKILKCYSSLWRYAGEEEMISIVVACLIYVPLAVIIHRAMGYEYESLYYIVNTILIIASTGGIRLTYRTGRRIKSRNTAQPGSKKVLIVGGGSAGEMIVNELK